MIPSWIALLNNIQHDPYDADPDLIEAITVCAPTIFLDRANAPTIELLDTHLKLASNATSRKRLVADFIINSSAQTINIGTSTSTSNKIHRAQRLVGCGAFRKSIDSLEDHPSYEVNESSIGQLRDLFPSRKEAIDLAAPPPTAVGKRLTRRQLATTLFNRTSRGVAPSFDGWTRELLCPIFTKKMGDQVSAMALVAVANKITTNTCTAALTRFLSTGVLFALKKPNGKPRPIVISSFVTKLVWKTLFAEINTPKLLCKTQITGKHFCHRAIHLAHQDMENEKTILFCDASNAFGEIKRALTLKFLSTHEDLHHLIPVFKQLYVNPFEAVHHTPTGEKFVISIEEGVIQGCAAAPFFFAFALAHTLEQLDDSSHPATIRAVADDIAIIGNDPAKITATFNRLSDLLKQAGITLGPAKSIAVGPQASVLANTLQCTATDRTDYLGSLIGTKTTQIQLSDLRAKYAKRFELLDFAVSNGMMKQCVNLLTRYVVSTFAYVAATLPPQLSSNLFADVKSKTRKIMDTLTEVSLTDSAFTQLTLADKDGGNSLTDWTLLHHQMYSLCRHQLSIIERTSSPLGPIWRMADELNTQAEAFWESVNVAMAPTSQTRKDMQRTHGSRIWTVFRESALHWCAIRPEDKNLVLNNIQWLNAMHLRLRIPDRVSIKPCRLSGIACPLDHALACNVCAGGLWKKRHQRVLFAMTKVLRQHDVLATTDVRTILGRLGDVGPDVLIYGAEKVLAGDVVITHHRSDAGQVRLNQVFQMKLTKYADLAAKHDWQIAPLHFTSQGNPTANTTKILSTISKISTTRGLHQRLRAAAIIGNMRGHTDILELLELANTLPGQTD